MKKTDSLCQLLFQGCRNFIVALLYYVYIRKLFSSFHNPFSECFYLVQNVHFTCCMYLSSACSLCKEVVMHLYCVQTLCISNVTIYEYIVINIVRQKIVYTLYVYRSISLLRWKTSKNSSFWDFWKNKAFLSFAERIIKSF